jgi:hypothetical protein
MLQAALSFAGPTGQLLNYVGNCKAIQAPQITRTGPGQYTVTFLTAREIDAAKIAYSSILVECQSSSGSATVTNVIPNPVSIFNANANSGYTYQVSFKLEVQSVAITLPTLLGALLGFTVVNFVDRPVVMLWIVSKNQDFYGDGKGVVYETPFGGGPLENFGGSSEKLLFTDGSIYNDKF